MEGEMKIASGITELIGTRRGAGIGCSAIGQRAARQPSARVGPAAGRVAMR
jgi:hypothetical protein